MYRNPGKRNLDPTDRRCSSAYIQDALRPKGSEKKNEAEASDSNIGKVWRREILFEVLENDCS